MSDPYIGEIRMFGGNFAPAGWVFCDGQLMPISENDALFTLLGTTYGGDGQETFGIPDLRGRVPVHMGPINQIGESAGVEQVTLTIQQLPSHNHPMLAANSPSTTSQPGTATILADEGPAGITSVFTYIAPGGANQTPLSPQSIGPAGGSAPHDNIQPTLCINYILSLYGVFPTQT